FLGHIISAQGVATDPEKIEAVLGWPIPTNIRQLRGFLRLTGYYRKFVQNYAAIASPLTELLKKDNFKWGTEQSQAFKKLQKAMTTLPVLAIPDFDQPFTVETDASGLAMGAILSQNRHPIAFFSSKFSSRLQSSSTYVREMHAITVAVAKWRHYLLGRQFLIVTDHKSLKDLLTQTIQTPEQQ
ncbi:ty3-gypsy retrotransposon protein, partial [Tanacetum coccineum]